jgi:hypothetical protein
MIHHFFKQLNCKIPQIKRFIKLRSPAQHLIPCRLTAPDLSPLQGVHLDMRLLAMTLATED